MLTRASTCQVVLACIGWHIAFFGSPGGGWPGHLLHKPIACEGRTAEASCTKSWDSNPTKWLTKSWPPIPPKCSMLETCTDELHNQDLNWLACFSPNGCSNPTINCVRPWKLSEMGWCCFEFPCIILIWTPVLHNRLWSDCLIIHHGCVDGHHQLHPL